MRVLLWHGYLLGGTGSNVYTRALAREWSLARHDVTVVCQERHPERYDLGGARVVVPKLPGGLLVWLGFVATHGATSIFFEKRPVRWYAITQAELAISFLLMGLILGVWR